MKKILNVKEWFANKNNMVNVTVAGVLKATEKAVNIVMTNGGRCFNYWCPKSCLELVEDELLNNLYKVEADTIEEAIANLTIVDYEAFKMNEKIEYSLYK